MKQCLRCELVYADPLAIPEQLTNHYDTDPEDYFRTLEQPHYFGSALKKVINLEPEMRALDVGAGAGRTMKMLSDQGWDVWGVEPSPSFARAAVERTGVPADRIRVSTLEEAEFDESSFDLINLGAVLEHLYSPAEALKRVMPWLKPGGLVHVEVPSSRYLVSKLINRYYRLRGVNYVTNLSPMHPPYHLYEFTHRSFEQNAPAAGYEVASYEYWVGGIYGLPKVTHRPLRWWMGRSATGMQLTIWLRRTG